MSLLDLPEGDEANAIVIDQRAIRYQEHLHELESAVQQLEDLEHEIATGRMTASEWAAVERGRAEALRAVLAKSRAAAAYAPIDLDALAERVAEKIAAKLRPSAEDGAL